MSHLKIWISTIVALALALGLIGVSISQQTPTGTVTGVVISSVTGQPIRRAYLYLDAKTGTPESERGLNTRSRKDGKFMLERVPAGEYEVFCYSESHSSEAQTITVKEGESTALKVKAVPSMPYVELYTSQHVFAPNELPKIQVRGYAPENQLPIQVFAVDLAAVIKAGGIREILSPVSTDKPILDPNKSPAFREVSSSVIEVTDRDDEGTFDAVVPMRPLPEGLYWVRVKSANHQRGTYLMVTRIGLTTKTTGKKTLAYVADLVTGRPVAGVQIELFEPARSPRRATTGADGTAVLPVDQVNANRFAIVATKGDSTALTTPFRIEPTQEDLRLAFWTDRPVYRPGDEVQFKVVARQRDRDNLRTPSPMPVTVEITDMQGDPVASTTAQLNDRGAAMGQFRLPTERVGQYTVIVKAGGSQTFTNVEAAAYRKPDFRITVTPESPTFVRGQAVRVRVKCEYYYGGPVVGAKLAVMVFGRPLWEGDFDDAEVDEASYGDWLGDYVEELESTTNDQGEAIITYAPAEATTDQDLSQDTLLTFNVSGTENDGQYFEGKGQVRLVRGDVSLQAQLSTSFSTPKQPIEVTLDVANRTDDAPVAGQVVEVAYGYQDWNSRTSRSRFMAMGKRTVTTDAQGQARLRLFPDRQGDFAVRCTTLDRAGRTILAESSAFIWASASPAPRIASTVQVQLDQRRYEVGQNARALIRVSRPSSVLVTLESEGILRHWVVDASSGAAAIEFPIADALLGGGWVNVCQIVDKQFNQAERRVRVGLAAKDLKVTVTPDRTRVSPGDRVTYRIKTTLPDGQPISADVALAVVDESIYAVREDMFDFAGALWPAHSPMVNTDYSFPELYLDGGDKAPANLKVRTKFRDTAAWIPTVVTDAHGDATVTVDLPENVTTWRATAWAVDDGGRTGRARSPVVSRRDLVARITVPSTMVQGDQLRASVMVSNGSDADAEVNVELTGKRIVVQGATRQRVRVGAGQTTSADWMIETPSYGEGSLIAKAWASDKLSDGVQAVIQVQPRGREVVTSEARVLALGESAKFDFRREPDSPIGTATLDLSPTLAGSLLTALDGLIDFPYGCTEQTMSRFMPAVVVAHSLQRLGLPTPELAARLPDVEAQSLARLAVLQSASGGWGWFQNDQADPYMTAYVLEGLWRAERAGVQVPQGMRQRGLVWAREQRPTPAQLRDHARDWLYLGYALSLYGDTGGLDLALMNLPLGKLDDEAVAFVALGSARRAGTADAKARDAWRGRQTAAVQVLTKRVVREGPLARWTDDAYAGLETTARGFEVLTTLRVNPALQSSVLSYLLKARSGNRWTSTRDTALILVGLTDYLAQTRELESNGTVQVQQDGKPMGEFAVDRATILRQPVRQFVVPWDRVATGAHQVAVNSQGEGRLYASFTVRQVVLADRFEAINEFPGLKVDRSFHRLTVEAQNDGTRRLVAGPVATSFANGEVVRGVLRIRAERPMDYLLVEIPTPANLRSSETEDPETWNWWFSGLQVLDQRVVCFIRDLPKGESLIQLNYRAEAPGKTTALPATVSSFYAPSARVSTTDIRVEVRP